MPTVRLDHVSKSFDNTVVVEEFDLEVADGELLVLVGGSGSGKSTILRMLAGLEPVSAGTIHIGERDVTALAPRERDVAMVFQDYALYPHMTVRENLSIGLRLTDRLPYFISGVAYPDLIVIGADSLVTGSEGIRAAGFFGPDWSMTGGEFVWKQ